MQLILASGSPRRRELMGLFGKAFTVRSADVDETMDPQKTPFDEVARELKLASATLSFEMTLPQIRDISKAVNMELIAYGRLPLMITEQCLIKNKTGECACQTGVPVKLTDKTGADFPVIKEADTCRSVLLNGKKLYWLDRQNDLAKLGLWAVRMNFTTENAREVDRILEEYLVPTSFDPGACTRGLYLRGVE